MDAAAEAMIVTKMTVAKIVTKMTVTKMKTVAAAVVMEQKNSS
jgi:hypothetical protein